MMSCPWPRSPGFDCWISFVPVFSCMYRRSVPELRVSLVPLKMFNPYSVLSKDRSKAVLLWWIFFATYVESLSLLYCLACTV